MLADANTYKGYRFNVEMDEGQFVVSINDPMWGKDKENNWEKIPESKADTTGEAESKARRAIDKRIAAEMASMSESLDRYSANFIDHSPKDPKKAEFSKDPVFAEAQKGNAGEQSPSLLLNVKHVFKVTPNEYVWVCDVLENATLDAKTIRGRSVKMGRQGGNAPQDRFKGKKFKVLSAKPDPNNKALVGLTVTEV